MAGLTSAEFVTIHCPGFVAVIGPTKPPWHRVHRFFEVTVRLQKKDVGHNEGGKKHLYNPYTNYNQLGSCRTSLRKFRLPLEYTSSIRNIV